jgi:hypothetical protein
MDSDTAASGTIVKLISRVAAPNLDQSAAAAERKWAAANQSNAAIN